MVVTGANFVDIRDNSATAQRTLTEAMVSDKPFPAADKNSTTVAKTLWDGNGKWVVIGIAALLIAGIAYLLIKK